MSISNLFVPNTYNIYANSITLPSSGGTPSQLNYYEEGTFTGAVSVAISGSIAIHFVRVGKLVTLNWTNISGSWVSSGAINVTNIPARLLPAHQLDFVVLINDGTGSTDTASALTLNNSTGFTVAKNIGGASWTVDPGNTIIAYETAITYSIN